MTSDVPGDRGAADCGTDTRPEPDATVLLPGRLSASSDCVILKGRLCPCVGRECTVYSHRVPRAAMLYSEHL